MSDGIGIGKNVIILGADISSLLDVDNKILIYWYTINFSERGKNIFLRMHYNGSKSYLFLYGVKIYQFKEKDSELNAYLLCLGNISKYVTVDNIKKLDYMHICMIFRLLR